MATIQKDLFVEFDEKLMLKDQPVLKLIADALPETPIIRPWQICQVLPISEDVIYSWIRAFKFEYIDLTSGEERSRYGIVRKSFLTFLSTRINKVR